MFYTYVLESTNGGRRYIGSTSDYAKRVQYHNAGRNTSTKPYRPYRLIYLKEFETKKEALLCERKLKSYKGGKALQKLLICWDAHV